MKYKLVEPYKFVETEKEVSRGNFRDSQLKIMMKINSKLNCIKKVSRNKERNQ